MCLKGANESSNHLLAKVSLHSSWSSPFSMLKTSVLGNRARVVIDLLSHCKWIRTSGYFGESLEHVMTLLLAIFGEAELAING